MNHVDVANELLKKAARLRRWSMHDRTEADVEEGPRRAALALKYELAAEALLAVGDVQPQGNAESAEEGEA